MKRISEEGHAERCEAVLTHLRKTCDSDIIEATVIAAKVAAILMLSGGAKPSAALQAFAIFLADADQIGRELDAEG